MSIEGESGLCMGLSEDSRPKHIYSFGPGTELESKSVRFQKICPKNRIGLKASLIGS